MTNCVSCQSFGRQPLAQGLLLVLLGWLCPSLAAQTAATPTSSITTRPAAISSMPGRLINVLSRKEILDLVAYLMAGGDAGHLLFQPPRQEKP